jgi:hypothetical protein
MTPLRISPNKFPFHTPTNWLRQRSLCTPSTPNSKAQSAYFNSLLARPFTHRLAPPSKRQHSVISSVASLLCTGRPAAIVSAIMSVKITTLYRGVFLAMLPYMLQVTSIHIPSKVLKSGPQTLNASPAILYVRSAARHCATTMQSCINAIKTGLRHSMRRMQIAHLFGSNLVIQTATTLRSPSYHLTTPGNVLFPAITNKHPNCASASVCSYPLYCRQTIKFLTRHINMSLHTDQVYQM